MKDEIINFPFEMLDPLEHATVRKLGVANLVAI